MADYDDEFEEFDDEDDEDGDDFGRVPGGQECDHCDRPATKAIGDHYSCDLHSDD